MNGCFMEEPIFSDVKLNHVRGGGSSVSMRNMAQSSDAGNSGMAQSSVADNSGRKQSARNLFHLLRSHHM
jgi:hypothetical protein